MQTPVILLSGFLGSGKTTLLLSLIQESIRRGLRPGILMNELGKRDVDGYILEEQADVQVEKLLDGCVCCSRKSELPNSLSLLLNQRPDVIYIELTGVADPDEIKGALHGQAFKERLKLHHSVTLLDAENALEYGSRFSADKLLVRTLRKQLEAADLIVVNKSDLATRDMLAKIEKMVRKHNMTAKLSYTTYSRIPLPDLLQGIVPRNPKAPAKTEAKPVQVHSAHHAGHDHGPHAGSSGTSGSFSSVGTVTLTFPQNHPHCALTKERLESFFQSWGDSLMRAKGHVTLDKSGPIQLIQYAGGRTSWEDSRYPGSPYLVCIGMNLNETRLKEKWAALFR